MSIRVGGADAAVFERDQSPADLVDHRVIPVTIRSRRKADALAA